MNINLKILRHLTLQIMRQRSPPRRPKKVGHPVRLERMKALKMQKYVRKTRTRRIPIAYGHDIGAQVAAEGGAGGQCLGDEAHDLCAHHGGAGESVGEVEGEGGFEAGVVEYGAVEEGYEEGFALGFDLSFVAEEVPDVVGVVVGVVDGWGD